MENSTWSVRKLEGQVSDALVHLERLGYSAKTIAHYESTWKTFLCFSNSSERRNEQFTDLVGRFQNSCGINTNDSGTKLSYHQKHIKTVMRALTEFSLHGCIQRRCSMAKKVELKSCSRSLLLEYEKCCIKYREHSASTLRIRRRDNARFLHYLESKNVKVDNIQPMIISDFMRSHSHLKPEGLARMRSSLRSLIRYLCMQGIVSQDLLDQMPKIRIQPEKRVPQVWRSEDVESLLKAVDHNSPVGKRDYAILLLTARLGMRVGDIRSLCLEHLLWDQARIEKMQQKGGSPLSLPITEEVGKGLIDYLRFGRPKTQYREVFLRLNAPIAPFGKDNNLHHIITMYRCRAGIKLPPQSRSGMHSLRHTVASRLLEKKVPMETISSIMGHLSLDTTRIYTKIDIETLRSVAICPEEVFNA